MSTRTVTATLLAALLSVVGLAACGDRTAGPEGDRAVALHLQQKQ